MHAHHQQIALRPRRLYRCKNRCFIRSRRAVRSLLDMDVQFTCGWSSLSGFRFPFSHRVIPSQPTLIPFAFGGSLVATPSPNRRWSHRKLEASLFQVFAALNEPRPPLVHHMVVRERHNLDPARPSACGALRLARSKSERRVPCMNAPAQPGVSRFHKSKVRSLRHVPATSPEQRRPPRLAIARCGSRSPHCLMRESTSPATAKLTCARSVDMSVRPPQRGSSGRDRRTAGSAAPARKTYADHGKRPPAFTQNAQSCPARVLHQTPRPSANPSGRPMPFAPAMAPWLPNLRLVPAYRAPATLPGSQNDCPRTP